jgi:hypothetical protein
MERHLDSVHHFLREVIPFRFLNTAEIMSLADSAEITRFSRSDVIRPAGKEGAGLILILEGRLKMGSELRGKDQGALLGPGQFIGEWETLFSLPAALSVTADGDGSLARLEEGRVRDLIRTNGAFAQALASIFRDRRGIFAPFERFRAELMRGVAQGHFELADLLDHYRDLRPALHPLAAEPTNIDYGALQYGVRRLPENISRTFALLLRDELPEVFDEAEDAIPEVSTMARRRSVREMLPGKDLVLLRGGLSDLTDLVSCLCLYAVEVRKIRQKLYYHRSFPLISRWLSDPGNFSKDGREDLPAAMALLEKIHFDQGERDALMEIWPGRCIGRLYEIGLHREMFSIDVRRHRTRHDGRRAELWTAQIAAALRELIGTDPGELAEQRGIHIVSSNTHSVTNCFNPWYREHAEEVIAWGRSAKHDLTEHRWKQSMDLVYALSRDYFAAHPEERRALETAEARRGIVSLPGTLATGIEVQIIDLDRAAGPGMDPRIAASEYAGGDIIINIDYAFGEQAEHVLRSLVLLLHRNIRSVNFLGKAGALTGSRGDILVPSCFIQQIGDEVQELIPYSRHSLGRLQDQMGVDRVHVGPMVTVEGTLLQNRILLMYYQRLWQAVGIEMEGAYYHHQVAESIRTGLIPADIPQRYFYYVSDLPLGSGHNLSVPMAAAEGIPPLYAISAEVISGILQG